MHVAKTDVKGDIAEMVEQRGGYVRAAGFGVALCEGVEAIDEPFSTLAEALAHVVCGVAECAH